MKHIVITSAIFALILTAGCGKKEPARDGASEDSSAAAKANGGMVLAYQLGDIYAISLPGGEPIPVAEGYDPDISPDGKRVAYTKYGTDGARFIAVKQILGGTERVFRKVPGGNNFGPRWSADGKRIVFSHYNGTTWMPAFTDAEGKGFTVLGLKHAGRTGGGLYSPCWSRDGEFVFCQDLDSLFCFAAASGTLRWKRAFRDMMGAYSDSVSATSASRLTVHPDGKTMLIGFDAYDYPLGVAYAYNIEAQTATRIGPLNYHIMEPSWTPDGTGIVFTGCPLDKATLERIRNMEEIETGIYTSARDGSRTTLLVKDGVSPTAAARPAM